MAEDDAGATEEAKPKPIRVPHKLTKKERAWAVACGALILGTGIVAVFVVDRDWGPVSLILIGAVLLLSGLTGRLPYVKWGAGELDYRTYEQFIEIMETPPEERAEKLEELAASVPAELAPEVRKLATEAQLMGLVRASLPRHVSVSDGIGVGYMSSDAVLMDSTGQKLALVVKRNIGRDLYGTLRRALQDLRSMDALIAGGLIVHTRPIPQDLKEALRQVGWEPVLAGNVDDPKTVEALRGAIERGFTRGS